jgi:hypothetical protein
MTPLSNFYRPLRAILADRNPLVRRYPDAALDDALKTTVQLGKLEDRALDVTETGIEPTIITAADFARVCYHTAILFVAPEPAGRHFRTRDFSESVGDVKGFLMQLEAQIYDLDNGAGFTGWKALRGWFSAVLRDPEALALPSSFTLESPLLPGAYLLGAPSWGQGMLLVRATATAWASQGVDTILALEVNGQVTDRALVLPQGDANEEITGQAASLLLPIDAGDLVRWKVTQAPTEAAACAWHCTLTLTAQPQ